MFKCIISIAFAVMSVSDIVFAENGCRVRFFKLKDAVNNVFNCNNADKAIDALTFDIYSKDLIAKKGILIKFLEDKILEKFNNKSIGIYCLKAFDRSHNPLGVLCMGGAMNVNTLNKKIDANQDDVVYKLINDIIAQDGALDVYFYLLDKPTGPTDNKKNPSGENESSKKCCC